MFISSRASLPPADRGERQTGSTDGLDETLGRLSKKSGVKATIVLDRTSGTILKTSGQISSIRTTRTASGSGANPASSFDAGPGQINEKQGAEELAALVWAFVSTAGSLVQEMDTEVH